MSPWTSVAGGRQGIARAISLDEPDEWIHPASRHASSLRVRRSAPHCGRPTACISSRVLHVCRCAPLLALTYHSRLHRLKSTKEPGWLSADGQGHPKSLIWKCCSAGQRVQPSLQKSSFRFLPGEPERSFVGLPGLLALSQPPTEFRPCRMSQVVLGQF